MNSVKFMHIMQDEDQKNAYFDITGSKEVRSRKPRFLPFPFAPFIHQAQSASKETTVSIVRG